MVAGAMRGGICGHVKRLKLQLPDNITIYEFVKIPSPQFRELCDLCSAILLFSCSEGMSTSLITGMRSGLVPLTCKNNGMEVCEDMVIFSEGFHLEEIETAMIKFIDMDDNSYIRLCNNIYDYANDVFTLEHFEVSFRKAMDELIENQPD